MAEPTLPEQIGHYRVVRKIGEGGMGITPLMTSPHGVKLLDFGLAIADTTSASSGGEDPKQRLTQRSVIMGTPRYMSPDQPRGSQVDPR